MRAAVLRQLGGPPTFTDFDPPTAGRGQVLIEVSAAGVHHLDLAKASGSYYTGLPAIPSVCGSDGVGRTPDGRRVYFDGTVAPHGSWAEFALVPDENLLEPADDVDDVTAAALGNTGLAAWLALSWRARLQPGEAVLVLGANGALGSVAVQAAKALGASLVVAADRDPVRLRRLSDRGANVAVAFTPDVDLAAALRDASGGRGFDVIIDPLWGEPAVAAMRAAAPGARMVQLGHVAGLTTALPATAVRALGIDLMGFAFFHAPRAARQEAYRELTRLAAAERLVVDIEAMPLAKVGEAWHRQQGGPRTKIVMIP